MSVFAGRVAVIPWFWSIVTRPVPMNSVAAPMSPAFPAAAFQAGRGHSGEKAEKHFSPLVQQFLSYLKLEKHFSEYTVKSYGADLIQFGQFLSGEIGQARPSGATAKPRAATARRRRRRRCRRRNWTSGSSAASR